MYFVFDNHTECWKIHVNFIPLRFGILSLGFPIQNYQFSQCLPFVFRIWRFRLYFTFYDQFVFIFIFHQSICCVLGPPDAPLVTKITVSGKQCLLQWREPYDGQSAITRYTVYVWVFVATSGSYSKERLNSWNTTKHNYSLELDWDQKYTVAVSAWNKYGESSPLLERHFRTDQAPKGKS